MMRHILRYMRWPQDLKEKIISLLQRVCQVNDAHNLWITMYRGRLLKCCGGFEEFVDQILPICNGKSRYKFNSQISLFFATSKGNGPQSTEFHIFLFQKVTILEKSHEIVNNWFLTKFCFENFLNLSFHHEKSHFSTPSSPYSDL